MEYRTSRLKFDAEVYGSDIVLLYAMVYLSWQDIVAYFGEGNMIQCHE